MRLNKFCWDLLMTELLFFVSCFCRYELTSSYLDTSTAKRVSSAKKSHIVVECRWLCSNSSPKWHVVDICDNNNKPSYYIIEFFRSKLINYHSVYWITPLPIRNFSLTSFRRSFLNHLLQKDRKMKRKVIRSVEYHSDIDFKMNFASLFALTKEGESKLVLTWMVMILTSQLILFSSSLLVCKGM